MNREIIISGAIANGDGEVSAEELLAFLKGRTPDVEYYRLSPQPGSSMKAAFDWQAILGVTASTLAIGQALWAAYRKFIRFKKEKKEGAFLLVVVKSEQRRVVQFMVGREHHNEEMFIREFTEKVERLRVSGPDAEFEAEKRELKVSEIWRKV